MSQETSSRLAVDILLVGNVTRDLIDIDRFDAYRLGGTVTFAAVVADRLGRRPTVITRAGPETDLSAMPPSAQLIVLPSPSTTTFANIYTPHGRIQYCFTPAPPIRGSDIPVACRRPDMVLLGPIADEIEPDVAALFPPETLVAAVPQGWMRRWDADGRVHSKPWESAEQILPHLDALVLSLEDIDYEWERLAPAFDHVPLIVVTEYRDGSTVFQRRPDGGILETKIPPRPAVEVDPTGAGDIFTTAFLIRLEETGDPILAARFGNVAASMSVEHVGTTGIPTRQEILAYMEAHPFEPTFVEQTKF
ncbi:MAG: PfkB family carbohydrate kinase [Caldilinea sp.]|nr:PfkB family carbohydrate kinase [Caldilinea sp.]MDW8438851.1 PfkB family carbohydrate kinase [Caldilineaceae bacterium]